MRGRLRDRTSPLPTVVFGTLMDEGAYGPEASLFDTHRLSAQRGLGGRRSLQPRRVPRRAKSLVALHEILQTPNHGGSNEISSGPIRNPRYICPPHPLPVIAWMLDHGEEMDEM